MLDILLYYVLPNNTKFDTQTDEQITPLIIVHNYNILDLVY